MPTDVIMPQMGESIFEGTLTKWLKKPGDKVQRDEALFEISTDKVDAEIPAPASGVLKEIKVQEGATVQVNTVVGVIAGEGEAVALGAPTAPARHGAEGRPSPKPAEKAKAPAAAPPGAARGRQGPAPAEAAARKGDRARAGGSPAEPREGEEETEVPTRLRERPDVEAAAKPKEQEAVVRQKETVIEFPATDRDQQGRRIRSSPLVRRIARDRNVNLGNVPGTGLGGRISKTDILNFLSRQQAAPAARPVAVATATAPAMPPQRRLAAAPTAAAPPAMPAAAPGDIVPMSAMRKRIAEHMVQSKHTSAHVHTVFEVDMTPIVRLREREKSGFEQRTGTRLTFMPFFARAAVNAIRQFPIVNSSLEGDNIHYKSDINLGIAVALDWGLIVPVVKHAEELNFLGMQRAITDLGERARTKKLSPDDVQGGTFTITNPGIFGALFGTPIINQPQVAILGVGGIHKMAVVLTDDQGVDSIAIRSIVHLALGFDHRVIDGAVADQFMAAVKKNLEAWSEELG